MGSISYYQYQQIMSKALLSVKVPYLGVKLFTEYYEEGGFLIKGTSTNHKPQENFGSHHKAGQKKIFETRVKLKQPQQDCWRPTVIKEKDPSQKTRLSAVYDV